MTKCFLCPKWEPTNLLQTWGICKNPLSPFYGEEMHESKTCECGGD